VCGQHILQARLAKEKLQNDIEDNRIMITSGDDVRETEEWEEDMVTTIMAETKKTLARARRLKEIEVMSSDLIGLSITHIYNIIDWRITIIVS